VRRSGNRYLFIAVFALCAGLVTLAVGHPKEIAIVELVLAIICAVFSLPGRAHD
jgi:hypothetical protein